MRIEIHNWIAADEEATRIPGLKELAACSRLAAKSNLGASVESVSTIYLPATATILQMQGQPLPADFDPNAPLMEVRMELAGFSTDALPDAAVQIPADYKAAPVGDVIKAHVAAVRVEASPAPVRSLTGPLAPGLSPPVPISSRPPVYTEEARLARIQGTVSLSIVVDASGNPQNIRVVQSLDPGLDQKAIEAVQEWKFQPGQKDGKAVAVIATGQVARQAAHSATVACSADLG
jgi:TonB family protein